MLVFEAASYRFTIKYMNILVFEPALYQFTIRYNFFLLQISNEYAGVGSSLIYFSQQGTHICHPINLLVFEGASYRFNIRYKCFPTFSGQDVVTLCQLIQIVSQGYDMTDFNTASMYVECQTWDLKYESNCQNIQRKHPLDFSFLCLITLSPSWSPVFDMSKVQQSKMELCLILFIPSVPFLNNFGWH